MRTLHLLRHAKSSWDDAGLPDHDRPLAPRGIRAAARMEEHLRDEDVRPDLVLCSSAVRARQTLDHVRPALGDALVKIEPSIYAASAEVILDFSADSPSRSSRSWWSATIRGSMTWPSTSRRVAVASIELTEKYPTGALATLVFESGSWAGIGAHQAELSGYAVPRELD